MEMVKARVNALNCGTPFSLDTQVGAQASGEQFEKIMSYMDIGRQEGAEEGGVLDGLQPDGRLSEPNRRRLLLGPRADLDHARGERGVRHQRSG